MKIEAICTRDFVYASPQTSVCEAAKIMRKLHIGGLIVAQVEGARQVPLGIVTDRDIVVGVVAAELSPTTLTLSEIMGPELVTAREDEDVFDAIQRMRSAGVRRMPVVAADGSLCGIVSLDDILEALAEEMNQIASLIAREQWQERQTRR
jgi:CBS domain-containing protein